MGKVWRVRQIGGEAWVRSIEADGMLIMTSFDYEAAEWSDRDSPSCRAASELAARAPSPADR